MREPASSLAKSSSRSSPAFLVLCRPPPSLPYRWDIPVGYFGQTGPLFVDPAGDSAREREANKHRRYITRRPQIPFGPLSGPNREREREQRDNNRSPDPTQQRKGGREREDDAASSSPLVPAFWTPRERPRATVSKGPWNRHRGTNWYLWVTFARQALLDRRRSFRLPSNLTLASVLFPSLSFPCVRFSADLWLIGSWCGGNERFVGKRCCAHRWIFRWMDQKRLVLAVTNLLLLVLLHHYEIWMKFGCTDIYVENSFLEILTTIRN